MRPALIVGDRVRLTPGVEPWRRGPHRVGTYLRGGRAVMDGLGAEAQVVTFTAADWQWTRMRDPTPMPAHHALHLAVERLDRLWFRASRLQPEEIEQEVQACADLVRTGLEWTEGASWRLVDLLRKEAANG